MPRTNEVAFNSQLGEVLRMKHPLWRESLHVEQSGVFSENPRLQPDILLQPSNAQPVVVETEYSPARDVESDAKARLGLTLLNSTDQIEQAIAVRIPIELRHSQIQMSERIAISEFEYCVFSGEASSPDRIPSSGWFNGQIDDLVRCLEFAMVSQRLIDESLTVLERGVQTAARSLTDPYGEVITVPERKLGDLLNQRAGEQTNRMAATIIANALTFHSLISTAFDLPDINQIKEDNSRTTQDILLDVWRRILTDFNYWPIFEIASNLLARIPPQYAFRVLDALIAVANRLAEIGVTTRHDLSGRMFQNLIVDRKFLATFYTLPSSATLLAEIALHQLHSDWSKVEDFTKLRIADLSCGTGTLLSAAYHAILTRFRYNGGDDKNLHRAMIENAVVAADIMPAAAHLCASQLSSVHPTITFENTRVYTLPYGEGTGEEEFRDLAIGSLDLLNNDETHSLFATGQRQTTGGQGDVEVKDISLPHGSVDLVIMNPPFTRATNHESTTVPVPSFAGFKTSVEEQLAMSSRLSSIRHSLKVPAGNGNAGIASNFVDLAHAKVKEGGVIALVLPFAVIQGASWLGTRKLLQSNYENIKLVTIASSGDHDRAFSAETGMAETLIIATKCKRDSVSESSVLFINLLQRPQNLLEAVEVAKLSTRLPVNSTTGRLQAGEQALGIYIRASLEEGGCAAIRQVEVAETMFEIARGKFKLPRFRDELFLPITRLGELGERGLVHRDIGNEKDERPPFRGPFKIRQIQAPASYPVLWRHDAKRERRLLVEPDRQGEVRQGCKNRADDVWQTASRLHFTLDFQINSQSLSSCMTPQISLGGTAWPNFRPNDPSWQEILAIWANSTLGLMSFWWAGTRQQQGRSRLTISRLPELLTIDPRKLEESKLDLAKEIFEEFKNREFLPANEAYRDPSRQALDRVILIDLLEFPEDVLPPLDNLRLQWCAEPSVHGGKSSAPHST